RRGWIAADAKVVFVLLRTAVACGCLALALWYTGLSSAQWLAMDGLDRAFRVLLICALGFVTYCLALLLLGVRRHHLLQATD
ncbi:MAG: hypothetical protein VW867_10910, partial [Gammaproteobacteria bacterium]